MAIVLAPAAALQTNAASANLSQVVLTHGRETIVLEPYAPNIIRINLSFSKSDATAPPGYGFIATPSAEGWTYQHTSQGDVYRSSRLIVDVPVIHEQPRRPPWLVNKPVSSQSTATHSKPPLRFYGPTHITISTPEGKKLLDLTGWSMTPPSYTRGDEEISYDRRPSDKPFYAVSATFASPVGEHYYGLGQNQEGYLDHRGHTVDCWSDYSAAGGESLCIPFVVTNRGYGMIWDNPSKTTIMPGFNEQTRWVSQVGNRVSFFVIAGHSTDEIYAGYRKLTGPTPMLPRYAYDFIQSKQRYRTQAQVMAVAKGYQERHLPVGVIVVDWFYWTKMGQMDFDPRYWPDPAAMNRELHHMGYHTMISVWPRFAPGSRYYDFLLKNGWFMHLADGTPTGSQHIMNPMGGPDIDTTNPQAARWFWNAIRKNILSRGFDGIWTDETEPDIPPNGSYFFIGPGTRYYDVYPLFHTAAVYDGFRRDFHRRALILARAAYLGAQRNGTIFWSSDIHPTWDTLKRQIPTGLDFTASGVANWTDDVGGFLDLPAVHHPERPPLLSPDDCRDNVGGYDDYPELYTRWFEYGTFLPIFRTHGSRKQNQVWSYGKQAEPILEKYLRLRYKLMPYIYSLAYHTYKTGAPTMRALFMDFPNDPKVARLRYEYMFGPAFLVAPVYQQGETNRRVYLPTGTDWYNYWTNERFHGGQIIKVDAPIATLPLFVRAGSIVPFGETLGQPNQVQKIAQVRVYAGADADFTLYRDDGETYDYEKGGYKITHLHWDEAAHKLTQQGAAAWSVPNTQMVHVIGQ
ncbi:MAG: TIM-barrel domain-containing protein [Terriglobia bacterium]